MLVVAWALACLRNRGPADGWEAETYRIIEKDKKGKERDKGWTCDLVPKGLIVARRSAHQSRTRSHCRGVERRGCPHRIP